MSLRETQRRSVTCQGGHTVIERKKIARRDVNAKKCFEQIEHDYLRWTIWDEHVDYLHQKIFIIWYY